MKSVFFTKYNKRNSSVEVLRLFFMFGIVLIHAYYFGLDGNIEWIYSQANSCKTSYMLSLYSLGRLGVTGFMFISGYYGIRMNAVRFCKILFMMVVYNLVLSIIGADNSTVSLGIIIRSIHAWDAWWFMASYFLICVISPILNEGLEKLTKRQFKYVVCGIIIYTYIGHFITLMNSHDTDLLLSIYIIARYAKLHVTPPEMHNIIQLGVISTLMLIFLPILVMNLTHSVKLTDMIICNNSPFVLASVASLVMLADKHHFNNGMVNWLASSTLAIYLISSHGAVYIPLNRWLMEKILEGIQGHAYILVIALFCIIIDKCVENIFCFIKYNILKLFSKC